ncbi:MAG TPA: hypothetical protein VK939_04965 [Longimicrobiales bacterium]|nr:hypothetical protein [Longimicrobiales bacterium]
MKALFVCERTGLGSAEIRGRQVAAALNADVCRFEELTIERLQACDVVVYVKRLPPRELLVAARTAGVRQLADPLDNYRWRKLAGGAALLDGFIAANHTHALELERRFDRPAVPIPHHHCNFDDARIPPGRVPATLGYVGGRDHWPATRRALRGVKHPIRHELHAASLEALRDAYLQVDVGIAFRRDTYKTRFNSAVKLVNFMSFGIPAVLSPEIGYLEAARHGESCFFAATAQELRVFADRLARDPELRVRMGAAAVAAAAAFHIDRVAEHYRRLLGTRPGSPASRP